MHTQSGPHVDTTTSAEPGPGREGRTVVLVAAVAYLLTWIAGLSVFSSSTRVRASGSEVIANVSGHRAAATTQYLLTEGLTAVFLVLALWPVGRLIAGRGRGIALTALVGATVVSLTEMVLGITVVEGGLRPTTAATVNDTLNRLDGVKMLLLAALVGAVAVGVRRTAPTWFTVLGAATVTALVASGLGYLTLDDTLATCAWASLPLLIATVVCAGVLHHRRRLFR